MTLAWDRSSDPNVVGYRVHYGTTSGTYDKTVDVGNTTTATVANLTSGTGYYFAVTAYNSVLVESLPSNELFKSTTSEFVPVKLTWDRHADPDIAGYRVRYGTSSGKYDQSIDVGTNNSASLPDLLAGTSYYAVVTAYNNALIESLPSSELTIRVGENQTKELNSTTTDESGAAENTGTLAAQTSEPSRTALKARAADGTVVGSVDTTGDSSTTVEAGVGVVPGKYIGVVLSSTPSPENAGAITLNTTAKGKFTGKLTMGGKNHALKGDLDATGAATVSVPRANGTPLEVKLQIGASDSTGELAGTISDGTTVSEVMGDRAADKTAATTQEGKWTLLLSAPDSSEADASVPQGTGHATIKVARDGSARISGTLADGTTFSDGSAVSKNNYLYVYVPLYGKRGALAGVLELKSDSGTDGAITGSVQWIKPKGVNGKKLYPDGFQIELDVNGESYEKAQSSEPGAGFPSTNGISAITLSGGDLAQPLSRTLSISGTGDVSVTDAGPERLKLKLNVAAGTFSGSFLDVAANKRRKFSGAVLQTQAVGGGAFSGATEGGSVTLVPKE